MNYLKAIPFFATLCLMATSSFAHRAPDKPRMKNVLHVVFIANEAQGFESWNNQEEIYQRIKINFGKEFEKRKWPVKVEFQRWSSEIDDDWLQLRIWFQSLEEESFGDIVFKTWMTLKDGEMGPIDYGLIKERMYPRPGKNADQVVTDILAQSAKKIASKLDATYFKKSH